jgi:hypothetical protein
MRASKVQASREKAAKKTEERGWGLGVAGQGLATRLRTSRTPTWSQAPRAAHQKSRRDARPESQDTRPAELWPSARARLSPSPSLGTSGRGFALRERRSGSRARLSAVANLADT